MRLSNSRCLNCRVTGDRIARKELAYMLLNGDQKGVFDEVANARKRTITIEEYKRLVATAPNHFRGMLIVGVNNGMGPGELRRLRGYYIDRPGGFSGFPADATKERHEKDIQINHHVKAVLDSQMRHLHHDYGVVRPESDRRPWGL